MRLKESGSTHTLNLIGFSLYKITPSQFLDEAPTHVGRRMGMSTNFNEDPSEGRSFRDSVPEG